MLAIPELAMPRSSTVTTVCNGRRVVWTDYEQAKAYFLEMIAGCVLLLASVIVLLSLLTRKPVWKIVLTFLIVLGIPALIAGILLFQKIRTLCSIREEAEGVYYMEYAGNYKLDDMLNAGITSDEEMIEWSRKAESYGIPVTIHTSVIGCSAFKATTPEGDILFGRNSDHPETDTLMVYSAPKTAMLVLCVDGSTETSLTADPLTERRRRSLPRTTPSPQRTPRMKWNAAMKQMTRSICSPIPDPRSSAMISGDAASNGGCGHQEKSRTTQYISLEKRRISWVFRNA